MLPALALHVTFVFEVPATEATKVCEPPAEILVALGETVTETPVEFWPDDVEFAPPPHELSSAIINATAAVAAQCITSTLASRISFAVKEQMNSKRKDIRWKLTSGHRPYST